MFSFHEPPDTKEVSKSTVNSPCPVTILLGGFSTLISMRPNSTGPAPSLNPKLLPIKIQGTSHGLKDFLNSHSKCLKNGKFTFVPFSQINSHSKWPCILTSRIDSVAVVQFHCHKSAGSHRTWIRWKLWGTWRSKKGMVFPGQDLSFVISVHAKLFQNVLERCLSTQLLKIFHDTSNKTPKCVLDVVIWSYVSS